MREISSKDIFALVQVLNKIGIKEFKDIFTSDATRDAIAAASKGGKIDVDSVGVSVVMNMVEIVFTHLNDAEDEIYRFVGGVSEKSREELEKMPAAEFMQLIVDIIHQPGFADFIKVASKLFS